MIDSILRTLKNQVGWICGTRPALAISPAAMTPLLDGDGARPIGRDVRARAPAGAVSRAR